DLKLAEYSVKIGIYGAIGVGTGGIGDAAAGLEFASESLLEQHFVDHGAEVAAESAPEYLSAARTFFGRNDLMTIVRSNGDRVFYSSSTNEFGVVSGVGNIRTYFKPVGDGLAYFLTQGW